MKPSSLHLYLNCNHSPPHIDAIKHLNDWLNQNNRILLRSIVINMMFDFKLDLFHTVLWYRILEFSESLVRREIHFYYLYSSPNIHTRPPSRSRLSNCTVCHGALQGLPNYNHVVISLIFLKPELIIDMTETPKIPFLPSYSILKN